ncbi:putative GAG-pre-integrase domain-containing protein [Helianthus annuus]|nr:putative GAG-pre-integrase domain-containing protein [Helianthus annuus]KAJ0633179.1 putative GAG-pre-integrase domain-containing protein [Helianthus annuus]
MCNHLFPEFFVIQGLRERNLIGMGECKGGLYRMGTMEEDRRAMTVVTSSKWNKRLGHPSHDRLSRIHFLKVSSENSKDIFCDSCIKAKMTRLPFQDSSIKTNESFDMIHCDIWGGGI